MIGWPMQLGKDQIVANPVHIHGVPSILGGLIIE